ncbi:hypothetical protein Z968_11095 [Clostridium novyi A str. 4552]|uniref:Uncharacterized protein n=1 Tax=Clostridium novyi A str. 4552 TaxID=1444289 RepID=A0A0A0I2B1_CLONO|nr:hypothetical protein [Clostridium novyi]KGM94748.1 hypothetical protein Z968_11095 [Clostridium novyi A str. 4552]
MNKNLIKLVVIFLIAACIIGRYNTVYHIKNNTNDIQKAIEDFINRGLAKKAFNCEVINTKDIDNKKIVLYKDSKFLGYGELKKGINNKYKVETTGSSSSEFMDEIIETSNGKYIVVVGGKHNTNLKRILINYTDKKYNIDIPNEEFYIAYTKANKDIDMQCKRDYTKFFNDKNEDITDEILRIGNKKNKLKH